MNGIEIKASVENVVGEDEVSTKTAPAERKKIQTKQYQYSFCLNRNDSEFYYRYFVKNHSKMIVLDSRITRIQAFVLQPKYLWLK